MDLRDEMHRFEHAIGQATTTTASASTTSATSWGSAGVVASAPPRRPGEASVDDDVLATLLKYEQEVQQTPKQPSTTTSSASMLFRPTTLKRTQPESSQSSGPESKLKRATNFSPKKTKLGKRVIRVAGGETWEDNTLKEWDPNDFRLFCGDLGNDVTDETLSRTFGRYPSFQKAKVIRDKRTSKTKGFGFVSFKEPEDFTRAMKELNGKYVGSRPIKLRKSNWKDRNIDQVRKKNKEKSALYQA